MVAQNSFTHSRRLSARPEVVFKAFEHPEVLANWWGPEGFSNTFRVFEFCPGGIWAFDMRGSCGTVYPNKCRFEVITPKRIVITHLETVHIFVLEILLEAEGDGSRIIWIQTFERQEDFERVKQFVPVCNEQNLDRLEMELAVMAPGNLDLVFRRIINAPAEKVFRGWADPEMIVKWFTPPPYKTIFADLDPRPGGRFFVMMQGPDGTEHPNPGIYLEVVPNKRLVTTDAFTEGWKPAAKPFCTIDLNFEDIGGKTKYTAIVHHWTAGDLETHREMNFQQGWGIATDQLEALINRDT